MAGRLVAGRTAIEVGTFEVEQARRQSPASLRLVRVDDAAAGASPNGLAFSPGPASSLHEICRGFASDLAGALDDLARDLDDLRERAARLPAETPRMVASSWEQTGHFLHEQSVRQTVLLAALQRQAAADLEFAVELVGRLQHNQQELRRIGHEINAPFDDAAVRLFRAAPDATAPAKVSPS